MTSASYLNPVYPHSFPDPFVLKHRGEYWGYCTGFWHDGRAFGVMRSRDLVRWEPLAGALEPLPGGHTCYWAPEVAYLDGRFHLYYSVGNEERMEIRVAVADHPAGPFEDSGRRLTAEPFAIDAHVFTDRHGERWLFYATDFLERSHIGTGTVRDRMLDPFTLAGDPRPVTLPRHDWHVYHPNRPEKGYVRWHTVEGSFVLERKGLYYQMFSGGNWQNPTYGIGYATARGLGTREEWEQAALPILRSGGEVIGPGHNSVVRGPDNRQLYCVYHRWSPDSSARVPAIDPLDWAGERMLVLGPTTTPQPAPIPPTVSDLGPIRLGPEEAARYEVGASSFLIEVTARGSGFAIELEDGAGTVMRLGSASRSPTADHLLRVEVDGLRGSFTLDGLLLWQGRLERPADRVALVAGRDAAEFAGFALTPGWEDLFVEEGGRLRVAGSEIVRGPAFAEYELVVNARVDGESGGWSIAPALDGESGARLVLERREGAWILASTVAGEQIFPLPAGFDPFRDQQFRFRKAGGAVEVSWEGIVLGTLPAPPGPTRIGLGGKSASFEMARVTAVRG
ncbi:MAG TPA: glycoside hydrolase family 43 protein [Thermoanaerobaculia bacterium]